MRETRTAHVSLGEDGLLIVRSRKGAKQLPDDARANLAAALAARANRRRPLLVDPVHLFTDEPSAVNWLHRYVA